MLQQRGPLALADRTTGKLDQGLVEEFGPDPAAVDGALLAAQFGHRSHAAVVRQALGLRHWSGRVPKAAARCGPSTGPAQGSAAKQPWLACWEKITVIGWS